MKHRYIDTKKKLSQLVYQLENSEIVCIDTEFLRERSYFAKLCLIQVTNGKINAIIDPIAIQDIKEFGKILRNEKIVKVFHSPTQDIEILYLATKVFPYPFFFFQIANALLTSKFQISLHDLVVNLCGKDLKKSETLSDWSFRPLNHEQLIYALEDVLYLPKIYQKQLKSLKQCKRYEWFLEEIDSLRKNVEDNLNPQLAYKHLKNYNSLTIEQRAIAKELTRWRENLAISKDLPRAWILNDQKICEISKKPPTSLAELKKMSLPAMHSSDSLEEIFNHIGYAQATILPDQLDAANEERSVPDDVVDLAMLFIKNKAKDLGIATRMLACKADLSKFASNPKDSKLNSGWRKKIIYNDLKNLFDGKVFAKIDSGNIVKFVSLDKQN
ncbi:MAG: HRDC domain-containing protein [Coriobacteriales bacterium]|nr:HRDC domain-containing protein [Coriobacteriales bacterium]